MEAKNMQRLFTCITALALLQMSTAPQMRADTLVPNDTSAHVQSRSGTSQVYLPLAVHRWPPPPISAELLGVDMGSVNDRGLEFVDLAKTLRTWQKLTADSCPENDEACRLAPLDAAGWPTSNARTVFFDVRPFGAWWSTDQSKCPLCADGDFQIDVSGRYKLRFNGKATLTIEGGPTVENQQYLTATNATTAELVVGAAQGLLLVNFKDTVRVPGSTTGSGITNLRLIRPGYPIDTTETWTWQIFKAVEPFGVLRFMNWTGGNNINPPYDSTPGADNTIDWSERNTPDRLQPQKDGVAWEFVIDFANRAQKDVWINVPVHASDDYVRGLATLLKNTLRPEARIYIEHSNEVWNSLFWQHAWNRAAAEAEVAAGGSPLNNDGSTDRVQWVNRRHAKRLVEISNIFGAVFGANTINTRIRIVASWFVIRPGEYSDMLNWVQNTYGEPSRFFYGIAGAPYFNVPATLKASSTLSDVFAALRASSDITMTQRRVDLARTAGQYSLKVLTYEGGPDTSAPLQWARDTNLLLTLIKAHHDPRMKDAIVHDLRDNWYAHPAIHGDVFIYFTLQSPYNRWGMWGLTEDISRLDGPKFQAIYALRGP